MSLNNNQALVICTPQYHSILQIGLAFLYVAEQRPRVVLERSSSNITTPFQITYAPIMPAPMSECINSLE